MSFVKYNMKSSAMAELMDLQGWATHRDIHTF